MPLHKPLSAFINHELELLPKYITMVLQQRLSTYVHHNLSQCYNIVCMDYITSLLNYYSFMRTVNSSKIALGTVWLGEMGWETYCSP